MDPVIVVTELGLLPPGERWGRLVAPLAGELAAGGLGRILDFEALRRETDGLGYCPATEVAVALRHLGYGRELVDGVVAAAGVPPGRLAMPERWRGYRCEDYFAAGWAGRGHFDECSQTPVVLPLREAYEDVPSQFLVVGRSGGDGIAFGYRNGRPGLWAYPVDGAFRFMAADVAALVDGWCSGRLSV